MDNNLLEKYLNEASRNLELKDRDFARQDIKEIILEKLSQGRELEDVLNDLGDPKHLGAKYYNYGNPLISGHLYSYYDKSLKIGLFSIVLAIVAHIIYINLIELNINLKNLGIIENMIEGLLTVFTFVTFSFFVVERIEEKKRFTLSSKEWDVSMLDSVEVNNTNPTFNIFMIGVYIALYLSAILYAEEIMIFNLDAGQRIKHNFQFILALSIFKSVFKFKSNYKSIRSKNTLRISNLVIIILALIFFLLDFSQAYLLAFYGVFAMISSIVELFILK